VVRYAGVEAVVSCADRETIMTEWTGIHFTDEAIVSLDNKDGVLFATTESGAIWVSFDSGLNWQSQSEIMKEIALEYQEKLEDAVRDYSDRIMDIERDYQRRRQRVNIK
jgi:hypothetical protein